MRPQPLGKLLTQMLKKFNLEENVKRYEAFDRWEEIVGTKIARVTTPERIAHGTLVVKVHSSVWKYELTMQKSQIIARIHDVTKSNEVKDILWK